MPRKEKKFHFIYKTTNLLTGRYYIGMHSTDDLNDGYMGSGRRLRYSINKHGKENHKVEILEFFDSRKELIANEKRVVTLDEIAKEECMNLKVGGEGGFVSLEACSKGGKAVIKSLHKKLWVDNGEKYRKKASKDCKERWGDPNMRKKMMSSSRFNGKTHSEETKEKMRKSKNKGTANPQFGTCWITKNGINKKIKKETLPEFVKNGWVKGRKM